MSTATSTAKPAQANPAPTIIRLIEVRITKPWRLSRRAIGAGRRASAVRGLAMAAMITAAALPARAQELWFDPDLSSGTAGCIEDDASDTSTTVVTAPPSLQATANA